MSKKINKIKICDVNLLLDVSGKIQRSASEFSNKEKSDKVI